MSNIEADDSSSVDEVSSLAVSFDGAYATVAVPVDNRNGAGPGHSLYEQSYANLRSRK